ncbi:MAG TPA: PAS domain S-box protein, partial [Pseudomonadales bacterium]|nr:PAS domain S-box protein [Pseudomonadales bacterium]
MPFQDDRISHVLDNLPALAAVLDGQWRYQFANSLHVAWFGEDPDTLKGMNLSEVIGDKAFATLATCLQSALEGQAGNYRGELAFSLGGTKYVQATCAPLSEEPGGAPSFLMVITDVSELKNTQQALDASTQRSHTILDTAVDAIITINRDGIIQSCNSSTNSLFGYTTVELVGNNVKMLMPDNYANEHDGYLDRYLSTGTRHIIGIGREVTGKKKDGTEFAAHLAVGEFEDRGRRFFTGFIRDMTLQKKAEQTARAHLDELSHLTRLSAIESLASGITHEINQPLTAIVTMVQALQRMQESGRSDEKMTADVLDRVINQCVRVNTIIQQMRNLARKTKSDDRSHQPIDDIVRDVLRLVDTEVVQHDVRLTTRLGCSETFALVNRIQIEQVLLNLVQNAIHAVVDTGHDRAISIVTLIQDEPASIVVTVSDNGIGLPEMESGDIFDPFFTTKEQGMGQGLSISRSIIETHGGKIAASDNPEGG